MNVSAVNAPAPIAVLVAIEEELRHLRDVLHADRVEARGGRLVWIADVDGRRTVLALCGTGMVSAAAVAESVIGQHEPAAVLNFGCAGAHRLDLLPGDIVLGERLIAYDNIRENADGAQRYIGMYSYEHGERRRIDYLSSDPSLLERARHVAREWEGRHAPWPVDVGWPEEIPHRPPTVIVGTVASADRWNRSTASIAALVERHGSHCEDMEAAAIAQVCASHDVPFLAVKDISNNELLKSAATQSGRSMVDQIGAEIGRRAGALTLAILRDLAAPPNPLR